MLLCRLHHWLVHEGGFSIEAPIVDDVRFRRRDGAPLPAVPDLGGAGLAPTAFADGPHPEPESLTPPWWYGEPLRLAYVVAAVLSARPADSPEPSPAATTERSAA